VTSTGPSDLNGLISAVPDIVYRYRFLPEPGFDFAGPSVEEITGYSHEEHYAHPQLGRKIVHPDDLAVVKDAIERPAEDRAYRVHWRAKGGREFVTRLATAEATVTRRELVETLWGTYHASGERAVEVHVSKLRRKLELDPSRPRRLLTERGVGYRLSRVAG
jgi:hypothetical protein